MVRARVAPYLLVGLVVAATFGAAVLGASTAPASSQPGGHRAAGTRASAATVPPGGTTTVPTTTVPTSPASVSTAASVSTSVALPSGNEFSQISATGNGLLLDGYVQPGVLPPMSPPQACEEEAAPVDSQTLVVGLVTRADCGDPAVWGEVVSVVNTNLPDSNNATISIATLDPQTGAVSDGPVVMTYASLSDTRPLTASGGGWLWIYDVDTTVGAEVLQISASTGQLVDAVPMPRIYRPILAADDDGLWIGPSAEGVGSTGPGGSGPASTLYDVMPGSNGPRTVIPGTALAVCWLVADGDSLWAGIATNVKQSCQRQTFLRFDGADRQPVVETPLPGYPPSSDGLGPSAVVGEQSDGLWTAWFVASRDVVEVIRIDPDTGAQTVVASVLGPPGAGSWPLWDSPLGEFGIDAVLFDGSMFLLEPAENPEMFNGAIVRVTPRT
jgi:hypothetical protein